MDRLIKISCPECQGQKCEICGMHGTVVVRVPIEIDPNNSSLYGWVFEQPWIELTEETRGDD